MKQTKHNREIIGREGVTFDIKRPSQRERECVRVSFRREEEKGRRERSGGFSILNGGREMERVFIYSCNLSKNVCGVLLCRIRKG